MLPRIDKINYEKCYPSRLKRMFQSDINFTTYNKFVPNTQRAVVGNLPIEIIKLFPKENRAEGIKAFQQALGNTAEYLRTAFGKIKRDPNFKLFDENYRPSKYMLELTKTAVNFLNAHLAESFGEEKLQACLTYSENGGFGNVYKLSIADNKGKKIMHDKALKIFHYLQECNPEYKLSHNNYAEANFWTFLKRAAGHSLDKTQFTKHYISDMKNGYTLTEFIDSEIHKTTSKLSIFSALNLHKPINDTMYNYPIMGKDYDIGGYEKSCNFTADKVVLRYFKKLFFRSKKELPEVLKNMELLVQNPKTPHRNKIQKAIELFKKQQNINNSIL